MVLDWDLCLSLELRLGDSHVHLRRSVAPSESLFFPNDMPVRSRIEVLPCHNLDDLYSARIIEEAGI